MIKDKFIKKLLIVNTIFALLMLVLLIALIVFNESKPGLTDQKEQEMKLSIESSNNIEYLKNSNYHCIKIIKSCDEGINSLLQLLLKIPVVVLIFFVINISLCYSEAKKLKMTE